jgi:hypothetical protein
VFLERDIRHMSLIYSPAVKQPADMKPLKQNYTRFRIGGLNYDAAEAEKTAKSLDYLQDA